MLKSFILDALKTADGEGLSLACGKGSGEWLCDNLVPLIAAYQSNRGSHPYKGLKFVLNQRMGRDSNPRYR